MTDTAQDIIDRLHRRLVRDASIYPGTTTISEQELVVIEKRLRYLEQEVREYRAE